MTTRADLLPLVYAITDRPDLEQLSMLALSRALNRAHFSSEYTFDLASAEIANPGTPEFEIPLPDRYRRTKSIGVPFQFQLDPISPNELFSTNWFQKANKFYVAGQTLKLYVTSPYTKLSHLYFRAPSFGDSFIAANHPEDILAPLAAGFVLNDIGAKNLAADNFALAQASLAELERNYFSI